VDATHMSVKAANFFKDTAALLAVICAFTLWLWMHSLYKKKKKS